MTTKIEREDNRKKGRFVIYEDDKEAGEIIIGKTKNAKIANKFVAKSTK